MDTTTLLYIGLAVIVVGVLVYQVVTSNSRRNKRFMSSIINSWEICQRESMITVSLNTLPNIFRQQKGRVYD